MDSQMNCNDFITQVPDVKEVLKSLKKSKHLERYHDEFLKLLDVLKEACRLQSQLCNKWRESNALLSIKEKQLQRLDAERSRDIVTINQLKEDLATAYRKLETSQINEKAFDQETQQLKLQLLNLQEVLKGKTEQKRDKKAESPDLSHDIKAMQDKILQQEAIISNKDQKMQMVETELAETLSLVKQYEKELESLKTSLECENDQSNEDNKLKGSSEKLANKAKKPDEKMASYRRTCCSFETQLSSYKVRMQSLQRRNSDLHALYERSQKELGAQIQRSNALMKERNSLSSKLQKKIEEIEMLNERTTNHMIKPKDSSAHKLISLRCQNKAIEMKMELLKSELTNVVREKNAALIKNLEHEKTILQLGKEKEAAENNVLKVEELIHRFQSETKKIEREKCSIATDLQNAQNHIEMQRKSIYDLENARQRLKGEICEMKQKISNINDSLHASENSQISMKQKIENLNSKLDDQEKIHQKTLGDVLMYQMSVQEAKEYIEQQISNVNVVNEALKELNQAVSDKDSIMSDLIEIARKLRKEKKDLLYDLEERREDVENIKQLMQRRQEEINEKESAYDEKETECAMLHSKLELVIKDCDALSSKMLEKNEKLDLAQKSLSRSELEINKLKKHTQLQENEAKLLRNDMASLAREKSLLVEKLSHYEKTKLALIQVQEELSQERQNIKTPDIEKVPWNIHRWRLLQGTDPERYELLMKHRLLQKRLIRKTLEVKEKDNELALKNKAVEDLKFLASKRTEEGEDFNELKWQIREKNDKIKVLTAQVNMYESLVPGYRNEIDSLREKLRDFKRRDVHSRRSSRQKVKDKECTLSD